MCLASSCQPDEVNVRVIKKKIEPRCKVEPVDLSEVVVYVFINREYDRGNGKCFQRSIEALYIIRRSGNKSFKGQLGVIRVLGPADNAYGVKGIPLAPEQGLLSKFEAEGVRRFKGEISFIEHPFGLIVL